MRLDKFLCDCNLGTRSEVKKYIKAGKVVVNGEVARKAELQISEENDEITYNGASVSYERYGYYLFHKPSGCVTAKKDATHKTVMEYLPSELQKDYAPVGRLDLDTEGLLLITNDGALAHHLISPSHHVAKTYYAKVDAPIPSDAKEIFQEGIRLDGELTQPALLCIDDDGYGANLTIYEGKYHQVKRMFHAIGCEVIYLKRLSMGDLHLGKLALGDYRKLTQQEIQALKES